MGRYHDYGIKSTISSAVAFYVPCRNYDPDKRIYLVNIEKYRNKITVNKISRLNPLGEKEWSFWFARFLVKCMVEAFERGKHRADITKCFDYAYFKETGMNTKAISIRGQEALQRAVTKGVLKKVGEDTYELVINFK